MRDEKQNNEIMILKCHAFRMKTNFLVFYEHFLADYTFIHTNINKHIDTKRKMYQTCEKIDPF